MGAKKLTYYNKTNHYYPFGMLLPNRHENAGEYRYEFNGMEKDDEVSGEGNSYTAEYWQYDSRLGRRWNVDPIVKHHESPYATFANNPIWFIDPSGADTSFVNKGARDLALDLINPDSKNYNEKFASNFQKMVDDKETVYSFEKWDKAQTEKKENGMLSITFGEFIGQGKNDKGQNLVNIGFSLESSNQGHQLDALFEEFDHAMQFMGQRIGFYEVDGKWVSISYDFYDEVDNKISRARYLNGFKDGSTYNTKLYGLNSKIVRSNFKRSVAERYVGLNYDLQETEMNVFDVFNNPKEARAAFEAGDRWDNALIGIGK